jgi:hypothetical protein
MQQLDSSANASALSASQSSNKAQDALTETQKNLSSVNEFIQYQKSKTLTNGFTTLEQAYNGNMRIEGFSVETFVDYSYDLVQTNQQEVSTALQAFNTAYDDYIRCIVSECADAQEKLNALLAAQTTLSTKIDNFKQNLGTNAISDASFNQNMSDMKSNADELDFIRNDLDRKMNEILDPKAKDKLDAQVQNRINDYVAAGGAVLGASILYYIFVGMD